MGTPFFSVLLPTRNRSEIVGRAIESVLAQEFTDFELIISDNDESEDATRKVVERYSDPRIRYFRTSGQLPMHENWENALRQARGRFVTVVEDKLWLTKPALRVLHDVCERYPQALVTYPVMIAAGDSMEGPMGAPKEEHLLCESLVDEFCRFTPRCWEMFPRALNSCTPRVLLDQIRTASPTGLVFSYVNPDYAHAFQALSRAERVIHIPENLIFVPQSIGAKGKYSNGLAGIRKHELARKFYESLPITLEQLLADMPVKTHWLWINAVLFDFNVFYKRTGHTPTIDWVRYHVQCLYIIAMGLLWKADLKEELQLVLKSAAGRGPIFFARMCLIFGWRCLRPIGLRLVGKRRT